MSLEPRWLSIPVIRAIHTDQVRQHGGSTGVHDPGLLESALERGPARWRYDEQDIYDIAAAMGFGIAKNHPFVDGNKRVAFQAMYVFLGLNGLAIDASEYDVVRIVLDVASSVASEADLSAWLRAHTGAR